MTINNKKESNSSLSKSSKPTTNEDKSFLSKSVLDYSITSSTEFSSILRYMSDSGGFEGRYLANGISILRQMIKEKNCTKFLSFVGALVSTGNRGIIRDMIKNSMFDCVITTCGSLDHDVARSFSSYYEGDFRIDDRMLLNKEIHRLGNVLVPIKNYGPLIEKKIQPILQSLYDKSKSSKEFSPSEIISYIGSQLNESSFLYWAFKNKIPIMVPGIVDGAVGNQLWLFNQTHKDFKIDILKDQTLLSEFPHIVFHRVHLVLLMIASL